MRTREEVCRDLQNSLDINRFLLGLLENVGRNYKKDGGDFAILSKNFNNCQVRKKTYATKDYEWELWVGGRMECGKYESTAFNLYNEKRENFTVKETEDELQKTIDYYRKQVETYEQWLRKVDGLLDECDKMLETYRKLVDGEDLSLKVILNDYLKSNLW